MKKFSTDSFIWAWLLLLVVANAWVMTQSVLMIDSARDFSYALEIAQGLKWPSMGPDFGGFIHTGPIWFYLLAIPLLSGSLWWGAFFIGLLAGLKFVLAYVLGREWVNKKFGLLWSVCLLIPGWHTINYFVPGHINVIETCVLAFLWILWRYFKTLQPSWLLLSGLMLAIGMHAHVTALLLGIFYLPLLWQTKSHWRLSHLAAIFGLFLLPFIPYLIVQITDGFSDWQRWQALTQLADEMKTGALVQSDTLISAWLGNLIALIVGGPQRLYGFVVSIWPVGGLLMLLISGSLLLLIIGGWAYHAVHNRNKMRVLLRVLLIGIVTLGLLLAGITALRSFTPFYMLLILAPMTAAFWAWLLSVGGLIFYRNLTMVLLVLIMVLGVIPIAAFQQATYDNQIHLGPVMNVRQVPGDKWQSNFETLDALTVADSQAWAHLLCQGQIQLHGPGALLMDLLSALPMRVICPQMELLIGGQEQSGYQQLFLMHRSFWQTTSVTPDYWLTPAWGLTQNMVIHNDSPALLPVSFDDYIHPPRSHREKQALQIISKRVQSSEGAVIMISHLLPFYTVTEVQEVTANGLKAEKIMANIGNQMYDCPACKSGPIEWQIKLRSNDPAAIDIITLAKP